MKKIFTCFLITLSVLSYSQPTRVGFWRDLLPYTNTTNVEKVGPLVYASSQNSLFSYNTTDNSIEKYSKITGLNDQDISTTKALNEKCLLVGYNSGNIDLLESGKIINISDIKRANIIGDKRINDVLVLGNKAYLSTGFGIVEYDITRQIIIDTYFLGPSGANISINSTAFFEGKFYAASDDKIYNIDLNTQNPKNFNNWAEISFSIGKKLQDLLVIENRLFTYDKNSVYSTDTIFYLENNQWQHLNRPEASSVNNIEKAGNTLIVLNDGFIEFIDNNLVRIDKIFSYYFNNNFIKPKDMIQEGETKWIADESMGLIKSIEKFTFEPLSPKGPQTNKIVNMKLQNSTLWIATGTRGGSGNNEYQVSGFYKEKDDNWTYFNRDTYSILDSTYDIIDVVIDPKNENHVFATSWGKGAIEVLDNSIINYYTSTNSSLQNIPGFPNFYWVGVGSGVFDENGNVWLTNAKAPSVLSVRKADQTWKSFTFSGVATDREAIQILITKDNYKFILNGRASGGLIAFNDNGTIDDESDDRVVLLSNDPSKGNLPSPDLFCMAEDKDGELWVGTGKGVAVFYNPSSVFESNIQGAEQIKLVQDGIVQLLLETEEVTAIAIDGANRKWIGTRNAGIFLMSADGTEEIERFNTTNSPMFSNTVLSIAIDDLNGDIYIGTDRGIIIYRGDAIKGKENFNDAYVFPNPVQPSYNGLISITNLVENVDVKITDIAGNLVYKTTANGGQATWDGRNRLGVRVSSGVYLVYCASADGTKKHVAKILFVN